MMMAETIFLLDFRHGTVQKIEESTPPRGVRDPDADSAHEELPQGEGFTLASLGSPPSPDQE
jgi:hypothetical protein